ncbi:ATP-dependent DNA helicase sgs1 [Puccinia graminis f. sp. tritici]|uniref:DNA 3'-5' helicase n=1 Tax=Puccinia graminis f. sp. tritici TaxID=56615 RepID=A0A5B0SEY9_PUCGR|nr:ATP-dependent DNA helicase sgs1 [Puccinia graminis f. sp. tritici]
MSTPASSPSDPDFEEPLFTNENNTTNPEAALPDNITALKKQALSKKRITLCQDILDLSHEDLKIRIQTNSRELYGDEAKDEQVEAIAALVHGRHTFILEGTGFGKTQIAEMYHNLFQPYQKAIVLVVNPLDSLGDNEVKEKKSVGVAQKKISAVNLMQDMLDDDMSKFIIAGDFEFLYQSPEALLNSPIFRDIYFNPTFQSHLSLVAVDEAHMVYVWGLVASGASEGLNSHARHGERGCFRVSYGKPATRLMATNGTPLLMMSATCRPIAIKRILGSLKLNPNMFNKKSSLASSDDLKNLYSTEEQTHLQACEGLTESLHYFSIKKACLIAKNVSQLTPEKIKQLIGGEMLPGQMSMLIKNRELFGLDKSYKDAVQSGEEAKGELNRKAKSLHSEKEAEENQKIEARKMVREAAVLKKVETASRVAKKAEVRRVAKEANLVENERKKRKKDSDMAMLQELKAQAGFNQEAARDQTVNGPMDLTMGSADGSIDPSLL